MSDIPRASRLPSQNPDTGVIAARMSSGSRQQHAHTPVRLATPAAADKAPQRRPATSPLAEMMKAELAAAARASEARSSEPSTSVRPPTRHSSSTPPRSACGEMPAEPGTAAPAAADAEAPRSRGHWVYATGAVIVGGYIVFCYYANALLAALP